MLLFSFLFSDEFFIPSVNVCEHFVCLDAVVFVCRMVKAVLPVMDVFLSRQESYFLISPYRGESAGLYIMLRVRVRAVRSNYAGKSLHCCFISLSSANKATLADVNHYFGD